MEHGPGLKHGNADSLSRLPCRQCGASQDQVENQCSLEAALAQTTESDLALWLPILTPTDQETLQNNDPALSQVMVWVESNSFPKSFPKDGGGGGGVLVADPLGTTEEFSTAKWGFV